MSKLATELPKVEFGTGPRKGPRGACFGVYKDCDVEDLNAVQKLREDGLSWEQIQEQVDRILGVGEAIEKKKFVYHWRQLCTCWRDK